MKKILVTGSAGQLGKSIQKIAPQYPQMQFTFCNSKALDITDPSQILGIFNRGQFDYCINCAAYTDVEQAEKTPERAFAINAEGVKNIAEACKTFNVVLIHISTDYVFDGEKATPYTVEDIPNPINEYGKSKLKGEKYLEQIWSKHFIIRTSWLYSKSYGHNFYRTIVEKAKSGENLQITDRQIGRPTDANNLATWILKNIINKDQQFGIYHFTDGETMSWYDFARGILLENGLQGKVKLKRAMNYRTFARRPSNSQLD